MRRLLNWAREFDWFAALACVALVGAVVLGAVSVWVPALAAIAVVLAFGSLTLAFLAK